MAYVRTRLGRWFVEEAGEQKKPGDATILLLHSLLCDGGMWRGQIGPLSELGRVVVLDAPGHGKSDVPPAFTLEDHARALTDAFRPLGIDRALVVGLSWGGMVAMRLALGEPDKLRAMVLLDTSADGTTLRERLEYRALCVVARRIGLPPRLVHDTVVPLMFSPTTLREQPELAVELVRTVSGYPREGVTRAVTAVSIDRPAILDRLREIKTPTLIGVGEDDKAFPPHVSRQIASRIAGSTLVYFKDAGHLSALENPKAVNEQLLPFVEEHLRAT
jgi:3-oxoadipate enol-lactonase